jgi:hypothetical protein
MTLVAVEDPARELHLTGQLRRKYDWLVAKLGSDLGPIEAKLNSMIDGDRIHTAGWMPGSDWAGTPFQRIFEVCRKDVEEAGRCFGLIVWKVFEKRPETWASAHGMQHGEEIRSRTYFRWPGAD